MKLIKYFSVLALSLGVSFSVFAKTPDGQTPSEEQICSGYEGRLFGLCNAYCEAMDCDSEEPHASDRACENVFDKIIAELDEEEAFPPCEDDPGPEPS